ncbi:MAG: DNA polymerase III subunit [Candidatus Omnitrophica bacterium]|nr:DNA polymerase III subunit [Candidatus Omnitrophota bacterium]
MSFQDIKGQEQAINILQNYLHDKGAAQSYLFTGPQGVGKFLSAKTLAKTLNCLQESGDCCDACASCLKIEKSQHPDVHIIDVSAGAADTDSSAISIEDIRRMQKEINLKAYEAREKVCIINDAHNLTPEASNALLKTLEEPPQDSLIILVTSKPSLLFKTIISRCKIIKFYPFKRSALKDLMKREYSCHEDLAHFLAYFCEGRIGQALSLKDAGLLKEKNKIIDELILRKGSADYRKGLDREELRRYLNVAATWFRDVYLLKIGLSHSELINFDRRQELLRSMGLYSYPALNEIIRFISDAFLYLEQNINPKLLLSNLKAVL